MTELNVEDIVGKPRKLSVRGGPGRITFEIREGHAASAILGLEIKLI